jgi:hypothetical protein
MPWNLIDHPGLLRWSKIKGKKGSNRAKGYLSSRVSWPSLVAGPLGGDAANFVLLRRTTSYCVRRTLAVASRTRDSKTQITNDDVL